MKLVVVSPGGEPLGCRKGRRSGRGVRTIQALHTHLFARVRFVCVLVVSEINIFKSFAHSLYLGGILFLPH